MTTKPTYFEPIRRKAEKRWKQLEKDPDLAGPWHQLFKQVQSPRHVLSELLQNADDAGATSASAWVENQVFCFEHNGEDFTEEHFTSLCRFGYSNKRTLHTIGFRGIGFKSTFSLGDCVELLTPTIAVCFYRNRFSEPRWLAQETTADGKTRVRIQMRDHLQTEVEANFNQWLTSPLSLLFCRNIRQLRIGHRDLHWISLRPGPIPDSKWMALSGQEDSEFLLINSSPEDFPEEALQEIKEERSLTVGEHLDFPPCKVEIVMGAKGQLFVVLPTGVETDLPFACNAPFIQDPARLKIKDPETSPTNRWLLERVGRLAASAMLRWLGMAELSTTERSQAYQLLPNFTWNDRATVGGLCSITIRQAFEQTTEGEPVLLTDDGNLVGARESIIIPNEIHAIWPTQQPSRFLDDKSRPALCRYVAEANRRNLLRWGVVEQTNKEKFLDILQNKQLPTPRPWQNLMSLWMYIAREITGFYYSYKALTAKIIPVQDSDVLYAANEVARLDGKKLVQSVRDWEFLTTRLKVMDEDWLRFLTTQRQVGTDRNNATTQQDIEAAEAILQGARLKEASNIRTVIDRVATQVLSAENSGLQDFVRLAQIAARLDAEVGESFTYITVDGSRRLVKEHVLYDADGSLRELLPIERLATDLLHPAYVQTFFSCSEEDWQNWVSSGHAHLLTFAPFVEREIPVYSWTLEDEARKRGLTGNLSNPYVSSQYVIKEWDFQPVYWNHWYALAANDDRLWTKIVDHILSQVNFRWGQEKRASFWQVSRSGTRQTITNESLLPSWVLQLRELPCLPDTHGEPQKPRDLLRRTAETEMLIEVEAFVASYLDTEAARPLLDLLGVRNTPMGPDGILGNLRELANAKRPAIREVEKRYRGLDRMVGRCSRADLERIQQTLWSEKLILTQDREWTAGSAVCLALDENGIPGAPVIHPAVRDLELWREIGIAERPTLDLALQWLKDLPSGQVLPQETTRQVRALCERYPFQIWEECQHWLNLADEWTGIKGLSYALTAKAPLPWETLNPRTKQKTADLRKLADAVTTSTPFSDLPALAACIEQQFDQPPPLAAPLDQRDWLITFGAHLQRVELDDAVETEHIRALAARLTQTIWHPTMGGLEITPYLDGMPVGPPRRADVFWHDRSLYVDYLPKAKLAKRVPEEIDRAFGRSDIKDALVYSFERSPADVLAYLQENFRLAASAHVPEAASCATPVESAEQPAADLPPTSDPVPSLGTLVPEIAPRTIDGRVTDERRNEIAGTVVQAVPHGSRPHVSATSTAATTSWIGATYPNPEAIRANAARARQIVMDVERRMGREPIDRESEKLGYDIESRMPGTDKVLFIEVKGRVRGAKTVTVTTNELRTGLGNADDYILAMVEFFNNTEHRVYYLRWPFLRELDSEVFSLNYRFADLLGRASDPS